jgi:choline-sulfatase
VRRAIAAYFGMVTFLDHNVGRILAALDSTGLSRNTRVIYTSDHGDNLGARGMWGKSTMYEESVGVPMIMSGPDVVPGTVCHEPVSLVDCYPAILDCVGVAPNANDMSLPGASLFEVVKGQHPSRVVFSEYHAAAGTTGAFMLRKGPYKYIYYVGMAPMLFDLDRDPQETVDLGQEPGYQGLARDMHDILRLMVDPEKTDRQARLDQEARIDELGGLETVLNMGAFSHSPTPGEDAVYYKGA